jgi:hypothetical protein
MPYDGRMILAPPPPPTCHLAYVALFYELIYKLSEGLLMVDRLL